MTQGLKILILWSKPSGYLNACLGALAASGGAEVLLAAQAPNAKEAPYDVSLLKGGYETVYLGQPTDFSQLEKIAAGCAPDLIIAGGSWRESAYRKLLRQYRQKATRVVCMDTQWTGSARQWLMVAMMRASRKFYYDKAFPAGDRQANYAARLGFAPGDIETGLYSCDHAGFASACVEAGRERFDSPSFMFVGRQIPLKGLAELLEGYDIYRSQTDEPWPLDVCGTGPMEEQLRQAEGVRHRGFVQPKDLPAVMAANTTLLVPSHIEPWGVVIHEAASAGMSIVCSDNCGAGDAFVHHGKNGRVLSAVTPQDIANALTYMSCRSREQLAEMSAESSRLAAKLTPDIWAQKVLGFARQEENS